MSLIICSTFTFRLVAWRLDRMLSPVHQPFVAVRVAERLGLMVNLLKPDMPGDQFATVGTVVYVKR
jgi:hypothetical protein